MTKFNPKRVLWLSYRKTLTYDIYTNFNRFGFKSYLDHHYNADRIIIQLESLLHIEGDCFFLEDDVIEDTQRYDLIIIDEIESILNQFSSDATFKGRNHMTFEYMMDIIKVSNKVIALDGDMACRSYSFLDKLGLSININNAMNFNTKTIRIINDEIDFIQMIIHSFRYGQKIFIPTMSNAFAEDIEKTLKNNFPHVCHKIRIYNSTQSDNVKANDMKNILEIWSDLDCVISTPTIEAGVSYDCERFDRILGVISDGSCSQRSFFQMMARVRKIKNHEIVLLNLSRFRLNKVNPWNYDEVKQGLMLTEMVPLQKIKIIDMRYPLITKITFIIKLRS
jgi:hypothetical protein